MTRLQLKPFLVVTAVVWGAFMVLLALSQSGCSGQLPPWSPDAPHRAVIDQYHARHAMDRARCVERFGDSEQLQTCVILVDFLWAQCFLEYYQKGNLEECPESVFADVELSEPSESSPELPKL